jgi:ribonuclease HII
MRANIIVGIDEVGRGCLAGPLVAAAVILDKPIDGQMDSKLLSKAKREQLAKIIERDALAVGIGWTDVELINREGLTFAVGHAMREAISKIKVEYDKVIIDGNYNFLADYPSVSVVIKADQTIASVSAASIVAKVYRDNWMARLSEKFPEYGFDKHVGYGTKQHLDMIDAHGPCELHRMFYKPLLKFTS